MDKFHGIIGFGVSEEYAPGKFRDSIVERTYYGDILKDTTKYSQGSTPTGTLDIASKFSILADGYAKEHYKSIRYVCYMGEKWKASLVDPMAYPRIIITVGGKYNGR